MTLHPKYITDEKGNKNAVVLPIKEYDRLLEELEDADDIKAYDEAKKNDDGVRINIDEAFKRIEAKRKKK
jgi:PHD/YefM family antitoxin component YafN of YafNO toxin-antitoxin module